MPAAQMPPSFHGMTDIGKVFLVGAGPGDPGLLTLKGQAALKLADLVLYDGLVNPLILRHSNATAERTNRVGSGSQRRLDQAEINQRLIDAARSGKTVVRLKGGDPFIFGRGSEEALALAKAGIPYEVIPGITAATAAAEYAGISLTHREHASAVAFVTGHEDPTKPESALDYGQLAGFPGTLVFYMGLHRIAKIASALIDHGKPVETPVAVISRGSTPLQRTITGTLQDIPELVESAQLRPPSLIIVGSCILQREEINWFETLPLAGLTIGIARPEQQADAAIDLVLAYGGRPLVMPTIEINELTDWSDVDQAIDQLDSIDWMIFTSVNGVNSFLGRILQRGRDARSLSSLKIACIGPATAQELERYSLRADLVPAVFRGENLAAELKPYVSGKRVLWPRADRGREVLPEELRSSGAEVLSLIVYKHEDLENLDSEIVAALRGGEVDWICLSSPVIARNCARLLTALNLASIPKFAAISPVTEAAAREAGLELAAVATEHTWPGLIDALIRSIGEA